MTHGPQFNSCYLFAFPKSGSVLINGIAAGLMADLGIPIIDIPSLCFSNGISIDAAILELDQIFRPTGYCYSGFRSIPVNMRGVVRSLSGPKMLLVRDPRDMLVSLYFSMKLSHPLPEAGTVQFFSQLHGLRDCTNDSIDQFCVSNIDLYLSCFKSYEELFDDPALKVLRYEDVIFDKLGLAHIMRDWFSVDAGSARLKEIVEPLDVVPADERPHEHVRQVRPHDYKRKLQPATIATLNASLEMFIRRFDYAL